MTRTVEENVESIRQFRASMERARSVGGPMDREGAVCLGDRVYRLEEQVDTLAVFMDLLLRDRR